MIRQLVLKPSPTLKTMKNTYKVFEYDGTVTNRQLSARFIFTYQCFVPLTLGAHIVSEDGFVYKVLDMFFLSLGEVRVVVDKTPLQYGFLI